MIPPLIPPQAPLEQLIRGPLPKPVEPQPIRYDDILYGVSTLGEAGRVLDRGVMTALNWMPGTHLHVQPLDGVLLVAPADDGPVRVTTGGYFRIPFRQRRRVGLLIGQRVLLMGRRSRKQLLVHPPAAVGRVLSAQLTLLDR
ncbi:hypothetical protein C5E45_16670 [Nocardia nova]|uniref:Uncharacterized protein n=1 Tax=Nocardia nova TaxID=37330 RepID=A0A2S6APW1_9NOCA|nr:hypothetical protein [Nocardia nova]PPJ19747.1 hypothetical protein C5E41_30655 [Nocardia nova]PPJ37275.1 hypothetical protein C5E45_16670 [Nocardia nova]